jgi:hypothetical protein
MATLIRVDGTRESVTSEDGVFTDNELTALMRGPYESIGIEKYPTIDYSRRNANGGVFPHKTYLIVRDVYDDVHINPEASKLPVNPEASKLLGSEVFGDALIADLTELMGFIAQGIHFAGW